MRRLIVLAVIMIATLALGGTPGARAADTYTITPLTEPRGAAPRIPYLVGNTIVDGATRTPVTGPGPQLIKATASGYVVISLGARGQWLLLVTAHGQNVLAAGPFGDRPVVSPDGSQVALLRSSSDRRADVAVVDVPSGRVLAKRTFPGLPKIVGVSGRSVFFGSLDDRTKRWRYDRNTTVTLAPTRAYAADLAHGLIAGYESHAEGDCSVLWRLGAAHRPIWRSCTEQVEAVNPSGTKIATVDRGAGERWAFPLTLRTSLRTLDGDLLGTYRMKKAGWITNVGFESDSALLMHAHGFWQAWVRAWPTGVNRATAPTRNLDYGQ